MKKITMQPIHDRWQNLVSLLMVSMMGAAVLTLLPLWVGGLSDQGLFSETQIGWLAAADVIGIFASSASAIFWVRRIPWKQVTLAGLGLFFTGNLLSLGTTEFSLLMGFRILAGIGCGAAYAVALAGLGDHRRPPLAFGLMVTAQVTFGTIGFFVVPRIMELWQVNGFFHYLNGWLAATLLLCTLFFPRSKRSAAESDADGITSLLHGKSLLVFATTVVYYCGVSAVWAYLERIGVDMGLAGSQVGDLLGIGFAISGLGSLATPLISRLVGRALSLGISIAIQTVTMALLMGEHSGSGYMLYAATSIVFQFFWSFTIPLLMDQFNRVDDTGRFIVLCASAFKVGEIIGPPLAASLIGPFGYTGVLALGIGSVLLALCMALVTETRSNQSIAVPAAGTL
ncbi:Major Facilitator Superfamily protein [Microbulbifer aggregans]|uniref:Major Facilitator Superfamily protein n=2 Tax=Microbulbifer aggregans TaxID=1769779 RepID=A0A1C9WAN1_9GAMM|nr:Major Facilitator Superfamily protein [Microbulbifer aggregans]